MSRSAGDSSAGPGQALERRERPLAAFGATAPAERPALPPPRLALVARQLAARVQAEDLDAARELAEAFGLGLALQAMLAAQQRRPVRLAEVLAALVRRWRP